MIQPFYGDFTVSAVPLEMSLNRCSHGCAFCFANLNNPKRAADVRAIMSLLAEFKERQTLEALLLREGYPVLVSNRVDPFAHSNAAQALPLLEVMTEAGIPLAMQTRGGRGVDDALSFMAPAVWYVSFNTVDEALRERLEPGAPTIASRWELVAKLVSAGHRVVVGLNPCIPEWLPEPGEAIAQAQEAGAEGVWIEVLHLNHHQVKAMSAREREVVGETIIDKAKKRRAPADWTAHFERARRESALPVFSIGQPDYSDFWAPFRQVYPKTFPVMQDFVNVCHLADEPGDLLLTFDDWLAFMLPSLPVGDDLPIDGYIGSVARNVMRENTIPPRMGYAELFWWMWTQPKFRHCPAGSGAFSFVGEGGDPQKPEVQLVDEEWLLPLLKFHPRGTTDWWAAPPVAEKV